MPEAIHRYEVFGLHLCSAIELPELLVSSSERRPDVIVRRGKLSGEWGQAASVEISSAIVRLSIPGVARYCIVEGREILVEARGGSERNLRLFLLGSALGAILHQRNCLPLHANAIVIDGRAIAFLGHSGAGKSTLAAWFHDRGYRVLADDVCVVTGDAEDRPCAQPGIPRLRLWREALEATGRTATDYEMSFDDMDKYNVPTHLSPTAAAVPLDHIYLLERAGEGKTDPLTSRLRGAAAVDAVTANTYRGSYIKGMGRTREHLLACAALTRRVPLFRIRRNWGLSYMGDQGREIEEHAREVIRAARLEASA